MVSADDSLAIGVEYLHAIRKILYDNHLHRHRPECDTQLQSPLLLIRQWHDLDYNDFPLPSQQCFTSFRNASEIIPLNV